MRSRLAFVVASFGLVATLGACHTFPDDPNATRWPSAPSQPPLSFVSGRVFVNGTVTPVVGAVVSSAGFSTTTDATGFYALDGQRTIQTMVVVAREGFDTSRVSVQLAGGNITYNVFLRRQ